MTHIPQNNPWFAFVKSNPSANLRLFCFPYAGGSAMMYRTWSDFLPTNIEVCPIELPGRGSRMREKAYTNMEAKTRVGEIFIMMAENFLKPTWLTRTKSIARPIDRDIKKKIREAVLLVIFSGIHPRLGSMGISRHRRATKM